MSAKLVKQTPGLTGTPVREVLDLVVRELARETGDTASAVSALATWLTMEYGDGGESSQQ